jgi:predicted O-methyltransferase YrrM/tetratricopeptide (TPR) repeat protein
MTDVVDVLMVNTIGPPFTTESVKTGGIGGSELEITQIAREMKRRGRSVVIANGVTERSEHDGILHIPAASAHGMKARALYVERCSSLGEARIQCQKFVVRATDVYFPGYDVNRYWLEGPAILAGVSRWQAGLFSYARNKVAIAPMLGPTPPARRVPGRFVYASAPLKGLDATLDAWRSIHRKHGATMKKAKLVIVTPGHFDFYADKMPNLTDADKAMGVSYKGSPTIEEYRKTIASAEGLFFVNTMTETFCCAAAFAERAGVRTHILCKKGLGGIPEALTNHSLLTEDPEEFERAFMDAWLSDEGREKWYADPARIPDRSPEKLGDAWEEVFGLRAGSVPSVSTAQAAPPKGGAGKVGQTVETYVVPAGPAVPPQKHAGGGPARRFWLHPRVLVGGSILSKEDGLGLAEKYGVTHLLSAESERLDDDRGFDDNKRCRVSFVDDGASIDEKLLHEALDFGVKALSAPDSVVYAHCQLGGSRGPSMGYLLVHGVFGMPAQETLAIIKAVRAPLNPQEGPDLHRGYLDSINAAISSWRAKRAAQSPESQMVAEDIPKNREPVPSEWGGDAGWLATLRRSLAVGGSEYGLFLQLWSLAVSIRASNILEIGRFKGASTFALAKALQFLDEVDWQEPKAAEQRPEVDYAKHTSKKRRKVVSVDPCPMPEAEALLKEGGVEKYVVFANVRSDQVAVGNSEEIDLLLIDGSHLFEDVRRDFNHFAPMVRRGGLIVCHDWYGWYQDGRNGSPIKKAIEEVAVGYERLLVDTGYASFVVLRKTGVGDRPILKAPARADGKPTVGLTLIARDEEKVIARAINSCKDWVDAITVVVDAATTDKTAEVAASLGAEVHVVASSGVGELVEARNAAIEIAQQRTDYVMMLDCDDTYEGRPTVDLTADVYNVRIFDGQAQYERPQIFRSKMGFRYAGCERECKNAKRHEFLFRPGSQSGGVLPGLIYRRIGGGWQDSAGARTKYLTHARDIEHHFIDHPECSRSPFYIGQSYRDAGEYAKAREWYARRARMPGWDEETYYSAFEVAHMTELLGEDPTTAYLVAYQMRPARAEPLVALAAWHRDEKRRNYALAYTFAKQAASIPRSSSEMLFVDSSIYEWKALGELGLAAHYTGRKDEAVAVFAKLVATVPEAQRQWALDQLAFAHKGP